MHLLASREKRTWIAMYRFCYRYIVQTLVIQVNWSMKVILAYFQIATSVM